MSDARSPRDLLIELRRSMTNREIANELQRDPRMVSKILRGETSGEAYRKTLTELVNTGSASTVPARRRRKDGSVVPVRAAGGEKSTTPPDTGGRYVAQPKRGAYSTRTSYMPEGGRIHEITLPKTKGTKGRGEGTQEILRRARSAAKSQAWGQKNVKFELTFANGRVMEVGSKGGYPVSDFLRKSKEFGNDAISWLMDQTAGRYSNLDVHKVPVTGVRMNVYNNPNTPPKR